MRNNDLCLSRKTFLTGLGVAGASAALGNLVGCAPKSASEKGASYAAGVYEATSEGKNGPVTVSVTFDESKIVAIEPGKNRETARISTAAFEQMPQRIIECQSLEVDTVSGATLTSMAILQAVGDCVDQAGGDSDSLRKAGKPDLSHETKEMECDVLVIGGGASGMGAAIAGAKAGAHVVVLEKSCCTGGNALVSGGYVEYLDAPDDLRQEMNVGYEDYFHKIIEHPLLETEDPSYIEIAKDDYQRYLESGETKVFESKMFYALDTCVLAAGMVTVDDQLKNAENTLVVSDFLNGIGMQWKPLTGIVGYTWPRFSAPIDGKCGQGYSMLFDKAIEEENLPIDILLQTSAQSLLSEDSKIIGATAQACDGTTYRIRANQGVVLATGGFSGNPELMRKYNEMWDWDDDRSIPTTNCFGHTGDGLIMAQEVGAATKGLGFLEMLPYADPNNHTIENFVGDGSDCLMVNKEGKRFADEAGDRTSLVSAMMQQTDERAYIISDSNNSLIDENGNGYYGANIAEEIELGNVFKAESLEGVAEIIGCDASVLKETVDSYNKAASEYHDPEFGRTAFTDKSPVDEPPFYVSPRTWAAHVTTGGIVVDEAFRVLDEAESVIEGLYAVGEVTYANLGVGTMGNGVTAVRSMLA